MSRNQRQRSSQRRRQPARRAPVDIWSEPRALPDVERVTPSADPTALLRSLGEPPMTGSPAVLIQFATVVERSAAVATALALSAGVLTDDDI